MRISLKVLAVSIMFLVVPFGFMYACVVAGFRGGIESTKQL